MQSRRGTGQEAVPPEGFPAGLGLVAPGSILRDMRMKLMASLLTLLYFPTTF